MTNIVFITGLPRSGTKLLRDLMNQNSRISIPRIETVLFPYLLNKYGLDFDLSIDKNYKLVVDDIENSTFYLNFLKHGIKLDFHSLPQLTENITWAILFEELLKYYGPKDFNESLIIGDKTPGYIDHTDVLLKVWPHAKFIHIIRDPRDYLCSVKKVWNKNIYRAANRWNRTIMNLEHRDQLTAKNLCTVYYEQLLDNPTATLTIICDFLNIRFEKSMLSLSESSEQFGDARGNREIVRHNKHKYKQELSSNQIYRIEQLVCPGARIHGYKLDNPEVEPKQLSRIELLKHKCLDGLSAIQFHIRNRGLIQGARYFFKLNRTNLKSS